MQTKTDGPLDMLVVNYDTPGHLRGYASFDAERLQADLDARNPQDAGRSNPAQPLVLGSGHLAMTIDPGGDMDRYQGIVALQNETLTSAAMNYFRQSEQLPTFLRLAVARVYEPGSGGNAWTWRAGGLLLQHIAHSGGTPQTETEGEPLPLSGEDDDDWRRTKLLAGAPALSPRPRRGHPRPEPAPTDRQMPLLTRARDRLSPSVCRRRSRRPSRARWRDYSYL